MKRSRFLWTVPSALLAVACSSDDLKNQAPTQTRELPAFDVLEADVDGRVRRQETLRFDEIPEFQEFQDQIVAKRIVKIEYLITRNDGGGGAGVISVAPLDDPDNLTDIAEVELDPGEIVGTATEVPLFPGVYALVDALLESEGVHVFFEGQAGTLDFHIIVRLTLEVDVQL